MRTKFLFVIPAVMLLLSACGNNSDSYLKNHIVGSWVEISEGVRVVDMDTNKILYENTNDFFSISDEEWVFIFSKNGTYIEDLDEKGTWMISDGKLYFDPEYGLDDYVYLDFESSNVMYFLDPYRIDESVYSFDFYKFQRVNH